MAEAPKNPFSFLVFLGVLLAIFWAINTFVEVQLYPDEKVYYTPPPKRPVVKKPKNNVGTSTPQKDQELKKDQQARDSNGETGSIEEFEMKLKAYKADILSKLSEGEKRFDVIVRYYRHAPDGEAVFKLQDLGYYVHERPTDPAIRAEPSNSLFYGDNVPLEDIQLVAITLMNAGIPLKQIELSRFHADWKSNALEVGADYDLENVPTLTKEDIMAFTKSP